MNVTLTDDDSFLAAVYATNQFSMMSRTWEDVAGKSAIARYFRSVFGDEFSLTVIASRRGSVNPRPEFNSHRTREGIKSAFIATLVALGDQGDDLPAVQTDMLPLSSILALRYPSDLILTMNRAQVVEFFMLATAHEVPSHVLQSYLDDEVDLDLLRSMVGA
jgi:hypothetical protein